MKLLHLCTCVLIFLKTGLMCCLCALGFITTILPLNNPRMRRCTGARGWFSWFLRAIFTTRKNFLVQGKEELQTLRGVPAQGESPLECSPGVIERNIELDSSKDLLLAGDSHALLLWGVLEEFLPQLWVRPSPPLGPNTPAHLSHFPQNRFSHFVHIRLME